ncbi:NAD(P)/FAD-dependent oxidoreductase [Phaeocystidibacter marisrubri]|uniref:FAD-dependent oxidoreductase n=1 Tax=Phaeocystidibacter marisrubri TaxID=1577780 RepID=A0A6L3ZFN9_9FLAO|nr:FAD-dependent oxidoreductase [Phaeocystidibacter marisrubri]KAB2816852.1 FAD-dependent oxidoreductase [Phaeocystidibacter marisrubri]GGH77877.1 FAD-dependent oxidoreductase [Phaeocystidibacter marisrubri]
MKDALIIGQGIAGTLVSFELLQRNWSIDVADHIEPLTASKIASGLYNPLVLKRRRVVWKAHEMINVVEKSYRTIEKLSGENFLHTTPVWESLPDPGTENDWMSLSDNPHFEDFIGVILSPSNDAIKAHKVGEVAKSGKVDVTTMISAWSNYLYSIQSKIDVRIDPEDLVQRGNHWEYKNQLYKNVIWCNGFAEEHPHFGQLPFSPTKGEVLIVNAPTLTLDHILHGNVFIMPLGGHTYKVGATYSWKDLTPTPTLEGKETLLEGWNKLVNAECEIIVHQAGIRPNVKDRKPLIGSSHIHDGVHLFNGLGSRGILMAPWLAQNFADYLEGKAELYPEVNVNRFTA